MEFGIQFSCWSPGLEVFPIKHNHIAWFVCLCRFRFLIIVLSHCFTGFFKSLTTELIYTCHPLNVVLRIRITQRLCSWPICSRVIAIVCKALCHLDHGLEGIIVSVLCHWQHVFPILLFIIAVVSEVTFQCFVYSLRLSISLWMKG